MMISKIKNGRSAEPAAWRGPKPLKIAISEAIRKKRNFQIFLGAPESILGA